MCELNIIHRFNDNLLLQDAYTCSNGGDIDFNKYDKSKIKKNTHQNQRQN